MLSIIEESTITTAVGDDLCNAFLYFPENDFIEVSWVGLKSVIVACLGNTHLLFDISECTGGKPRNYHEIVLT